NINGAGGVMRFFENILLFYNDEFVGIKAEVIRLVRKNQTRLKIIDVFDNFYCRISEFENYGHLAANVRIRFEMTKNFQAAL
ncbi:MAG: hypothetical protein MUO54_01565, partial [Anaerolineales bacterium]|nr:hypothetical protein [Anaerolineales bacterium]